MTAMRFSGPVLPDGEARELYVVDGRVTYERQAGAETAAEGWIVPGLVDAHCHVGLDDGGGVDEADPRSRRSTDRDAGALLLRDCGSPADTRWIHDRDDLPRLVRAGRHIARTRRYIRNYAHEVEPDELAGVRRPGGAARRRLGQAGRRLDLPRRGDLAPSFPRRGVRRGDRGRPRRGRQVTAHCFGAAVLPGLLDAGIDCIEHGTGLCPTWSSHGRPRDRAGADGDAARQVPGVTPTPAREQFPAYAATMEDLHAHRRETIMAAYEAGVRSTPAPTAAVPPARQHGRRGRGDGRARHPAPTTRSARRRWRAREWLGWNAALDEGAPADFVVSTATRSTTSRCSRAGPGGAARPGGGLSPSRAAVDRPPHPLGQFEGVRVRLLGRDREIDALLSTGRPARGCLPVSAGT